MKYNILVIGSIILVVVLLVFGVRSKGDAAQTPRLNTNSHTQTNARKTTASNLAPDFSLAKFGGGTISLSEFRGKKPVVLDFWASWCHNCRRDMPVLNRLYEKYKDEVEVIGINLRESESAIKKFITSKNITFPIALDPRSQASSAYGIQYTNTHFLIDIDGNLVRTIPGDIKESDILSLLR